MSITMVGLDIAKSVFQLHGIDASGKVQLKRKLRRSELIPFFEGQPRCTVVLEACGAAHHWARVLAYEPPDRVVFSWDVGVQWQVEDDLANASEVEVRFIAESPERTRVELEHRHLDRHGPGWESLRDGVGHDDGWPLYLWRFAALFD